MFFISKLLFFRLSSNYKKNTNIHFYYKTSNLMGKNIVDTIRKFLILTVVGVTVSMFLPNSFTRRIISELRSVDYFNICKWKSKILIQNILVSETDVSFGHFRAQVINISVSLFRRPYSDMQ